MLFALPAADRATPQLTRYGAICAARLNAVEPRAGGGILLRERALPLLVCSFLLPACHHGAIGATSGRDGGAPADSCAAGDARTTTTTILAGLHGPFGIAVDATWIYWSEAGDFSAGGRIGRADKEGGGATTLADEPTPEDLAIDDRFVYYQVGFQLKRVDKRGAAAAVALADGYETTHSHGVLADGTAVYFAGLDRMTGADEVVRVDPDGGNRQVLATPGASLSGLTMDDTYVYFNANAAMQSMPPVQYRVLKSGGAPEALQTGAACFTAAADGSALYCAGDILGPYRLRPGGVPEKLCSLAALTLVEAMVRIGDTLYLFAIPPRLKPPFAPGSILEIPTRGGGGRVLTNDLDEPRGVATDGGALYYTETNQGTLVKVAP